MWRLRTKMSRLHTASWPHAMWRCFHLTALRMRLSPGRNAVLSCKTRLSRLGVAETASTHHAVAARSHGVPNPGSGCRPCRPPSVAKTMAGETPWSQQQLTAAVAKTKQRGDGKTADLMWQGTTVLRQCSVTECATKQNGHSDESITGAKELQARNHIAK